MEIDDVSVMSAAAIGSAEAAVEGEEKENDAAATTNSPNAEMKIEAPAVAVAAADGQAPSESQPDGASAVQENAEAKKPTRVTDWPLRDIKEPHDNDVLYGRGGGTNHHPGNKRYRKMVEDRKLDYVNSKRLDKPLVALGIIREWRGQDPPGRFLKIDEKTGLWSDVGDKKAREKTSQALREKAPLIRKQIDEEEEKKHGKSKGDGGDDDDDEEEEDDASQEKPTAKTTRFAEGTQTGDGVKKAVLARDHSLGREYLAADEAVTLDGFSWQDPFQNGGTPRGASAEPSALPRALENQRINSQGSAQHAPPPHAYPPNVAMPPPNHDHYRYPSHTSIGSLPPLPGPFQQTASGRYESWGSVPPNVPPPPMPGYRTHEHSGSWSQHDMAREHSLSHYPLPHATVGQPASYGCFDSRSGSGVWGPNAPSDSRSSSGVWGPPPVDSRSGSGVWGAPPPGDSRSSSGVWGPPPPPGPGPWGPPPPGSYPPAPGMEGQMAYHHYPHHGPVPSTPPSAYGMPVREYSGHAPAHARSPPSRPTHQRRGTGSSGPPSPPYDVDPAVASTWSGQGPILKTLSGEEYDRQHRGSSLSPRSQSSHGERMGNAPNNTASRVPPPKPDLIKRATSNQNETIETRPGLMGPSVKRAALNRDSSRASNRLKELCFPGQFQNGKFDPEQEMKELSEDMDRSSLSTRPATISEAEQKPSLHPSSFLDRKPMSLEERSSTLDTMAMELMVKPAPMSGASRSTTIEALALDLDEEPFNRPALYGRHSTMESIFAEFKQDYESQGEIEKPKVVTAADRITTSDYFEVLNEPIVEDDPELFSGKSKDRSFSPRIGANLAKWVEGM